MVNSSCRGQASSKINSSAELMLDRILMVVKDFLKKTSSFTSAIVDKVNENGTVNVYFPPDKDKIFTNISNQTPFMLQQGDSVELAIKNGDYSNCWVIAKHGATFSGVE